MGKNQRRKMYVDAMGGELLIDIVGLFYELDDDAKKHVARSIAFDTTLIETVCKYVAYDNVEYDDGDNWRGGFSTGAKSSLIEDARIQLMPLMDEISRNFIARLIEQRDTQAKCADQWRRKCWELERIWLNAERPPRALDDFDHSRANTPTKEEVGELLRKFEKETGVATQ